MTMRIWKLRWGLGLLVAATVLVTLAGAVVMALWNWLAPALFGLPLISLAQAAGLLVLCRLLFGGFLGRGGMHWRHRLAERWDRMTPEERERFRAGMGRCGRRGRGGDPAPSQAG